TPAETRYARNDRHGASIEGQRKSLSWPWPDNRDRLWAHIKARARRRRATEAAGGLATRPRQLWPPLRTRQSQTPERRSGHVAQTPADRNELDRTPFVRAGSRPGSRSSRPRRQRRPRTERSAN